MPPGLNLHKRKTPDEYDEMDSELMDSTQVVDVIILSYARTPELRAVTEDCIRSLFASEDAAAIRFNCIVMETNSQAAVYDFPETTTVFPKQAFGYNRFINIGVAQTHNPYVCIANNDLLFHRGWAAAILGEMDKDPTLLSACPICELFHETIGILPGSGNFYRYQVKRELVGWCIFFKREMLSLTGKFDEKLKFWYCDNDYANILQSKSIAHALITNSSVDHLESRTLSTLPERKQDNITYGEYCYYAYKWIHKSRVKYLLMRLRFFVFRNFST